MSKQYWILVPFYRILLRRSIRKTIKEKMLVMH